MLAGTVSPQVCVGSFLLLHGILLFKNTMYGGSGIALGLHTGLVLEDQEEPAPDGIAGGALASSWRPSGAFFR